MKFSQNLVLKLLCICLGCIIPGFLVAQSTSWKGTSSTSWTTATNWTNGLPTSTVDAVIGDLNFTGSNSPQISSTVSCNSLTIGGGSKASSLTIKSGTFSIYGSLTIASNGTFYHNSATLNLYGDFVNNGTYAVSGNKNRTNFAGTSQIISGTSIPTFKKLYVLAGASVSLSNNIATSTWLYVYGKFNPLTYQVTGNKTINIYSGGTLKVGAATVAGNYNTSSITVNAGSTMEYSGLLNQTVANYTYSTLIVSGTGTKSLAANINSLNSSSTAYGNVYVKSGILDIAGFTANRGTSTVGGIFSIDNGATLKIGGTATLPINFNAFNFAAGSTVEYYGNNQTITAKSYSNLILSGTTGAVVKTFPATTFVVAGNFTSLAGAATSVTYSTASNITFSGDVTIGLNTTFNGGANTHTVSGDWTNNGTFTGNTGTIVMNGLIENLQGSGTHDFNNLTISGDTVKATPTSLNILGNFATTDVAAFVQSSGTLNMTGSSKSLLGNNVYLNHLTINGTITSSANVDVAGNLSVSTSKSFITSAGIISMSGQSKTISNAGTLTLNGLKTTGIISTTTGFTIFSILEVTGSLTASAGSITFAGTSTLYGTANLFNVIINGTSLQLATDAVLGIAGTYTLTSGTLNVTSTVPNTIHFNGVAAQTIPIAAFHNLSLSGSVKTAGGVFTTNGNLLINSGATLNASSFTHIIKGNFTNSGTFTASTGTIQFTGTADASIAGISTFNIVTINKSSASNTLTLLNNMSVGTVNMTLGAINTGNNILTVTTTRNGAGTILGSVQRTHAFTTGVAYAFAGQYNTITFASVSGVTSVLVKTTTGSISDFPYSSSVKRLYDISVPSGTYSATLRLQYEDAELNGNIENNLKLWKYAGSWGTVSKTANSNTLNYVELSAITSLSTRWTMSDDVDHIVNWNGSVSNNWSTAANWTVVSGTPTLPPAANDVAQIGYISYINAPQISTAGTIKKLQFGSAFSSTLNLTTGGSLTVQGQLGGVWAANATHNISTNGQALIVTGDALLSDGTAGRAINLNIGAGSVTINGILTQTGNANITFSGAGTLNLGNHYLFSGGTFTRGSGTVNYNGTVAQTVAAVDYNNLTINKTAGIATIGTTTNVLGNLIITAGQCDVQAATTIAGNSTIATGASLYNNNSNISAGGNWTNTGSYNSSGGSVIINGSGTQNISASNFNNLTINKTAGSANLTGNVAIAGSVTHTAGIFNLSTYTCSRSAAGGTFTMSGTATLQVGGAVNFPANFTTNTLSGTTTVNFNGTVAQTMPAITYGNLVISNGTTNAKTFTANPTINGDLTINAGATLNAGAISISLFGNWVNSGTFTQATSTVNLRGISKLVTGTTTFSKLTVNGSYAINASNITTAGLLLIPAGGIFEGGSGVLTINTDLTNNGSFTSEGTVTFPGSAAQNIQFSNALTTNLNTVNFNGTIAPTLSGTSSPTFNTVNINNTAPIAAAGDWNVNTAFTIGASATFTGNTFTHSFYGSFTNNGSVNSAGNLQFLPATAQSIKIKGTNFTSTGDVTFGGSGAITINGTANTLTDVFISNTAGVTPSAALNITKDLTIIAGGVFNASSFSHLVAGNVISNGTLNGGTSTFTLTGATAELYGSTQTNFYHLIVTGTVTASNDYNVSGNFTNNGTYDGLGGTLNMIGTAASTITGSAASFALADIGVQKSTGITVTLVKNITAVSLINVTSGILDLSTLTVTQDAVAGGSLYLEANAVLKIGGTNSIPVMTDYGLDSLSTVDFAGAAQNILSTPVYGNLSISTSGIKTATGVLNIRNNFTLANGTFVPGSYVDTLGGNWLMTSGTFTNTGSTILFDGADSQYVSSTGAFNNLKINKPSDVVLLSANTTANGITTFVNGRIVTGTNTFILPAGASVTGSLQTTGWVEGKLQKNFATGTNVSRTYEIGSAINYTPVTMVAASVAIAGNITGSITNTDHPNISTSELDVNASVNKYWTFTNSTTVFTTSTVTVTWAASELDAGINTANLLGSAYVSGAWSLPSITSPTATSIQFNGLSTLGNLAVAIIKLPTWTGTSSTDWFTTGNWSAGQVPGIATNVIIPLGLARYPVIGAAATGTVNNLTIQNGGRLTLAGTLQLYGSLTSVNGGVYADSGTVEMKGAAAQVLSGTVFNKDLYNLTINNAVGVTLGAALKITNVLSIKNGSLNTAHLLTLVSNSVTTARVGPITSASSNPITGDVTVERYIAGRRKYRLITSPVTTSTSSVLTAGEAAKSIWGNWQNAGVATTGVGTIITGGTAADGFDQATTNASLYTYNEVTKRFVSYSSANGKNTKLTPLKAGVGYYMFVYGDRINSITSSTPNPTTLKQTGTILTGTQVYNTTSAVPISATVGNFSLMGNPYACTIDWKSVTKLNVSKTLWGWDANLGSTGGYVTVTATTLGAIISPLSSVIAVNRYVQPGQAFFVQTTLANPQVTIFESDKIDDRININSSVFRETGVNEQPLMAINLLYNSGVTTTLYDGAVVAFDDSFDNAVTYDDGLKIAGAAEGLAIVENTSLLSINARKFPVDNDTLALSVTKLTKTQYTLQIFATQLNAAGTLPWLYDAYLNTLQPLSVTDTNYVNFAIKSTDAASKNAYRFKIVFKTSATLPVTFTAINAIRKNKDIEVQWNVAGELNISKYELLKSTDGVRFNSIANVAAKGNNNSSQSYVSVDNKTNKGNNYYQVKSFQDNGRQLLSKVVMVKMDDYTPSIKIYPNPVVDEQIYFQISNMHQGIYQAILYNSNGQQIAEKVIEYYGGSGNYKLLINRPIAKGMYYLNIKGESENYHQRILIQ